ncbi:MAG TPA: c-type cytochrome [Pyrinomonadaceae bacterium]|nr:c-type cytochrome [Pyrinomonadaceae bacterium]
MKTKIKIIAVFTFAVFACVFLAEKGKTQTKQTVETAGQKFKNIKVLNDMPADQLGKVMNIMAASLNVKCDFCHVGEDFAKDGKEEKETAREMIKMNFDLNKNYFNGRPEISCNTCHQGHAHPQSGINLYQTGLSGHDERPKQPDTKPTIDAILAKYETAIGGKANVEKVTSREIKAQRVEPDGKTTEDEIILQKGAKFSAQTTYVSKEKGNYVVKEIFDGTTAQKFGNGEAIQLKMDELEQIKREGQLFGNTNLKAVYTKMDFRFVDKIDEKEVYVVTASTADNVRERLYFDVQSGLLVRRIAATPTVLGAFNYQVDYTDYKDFGGVKLPTTVKYAVPGIRWTRKVLDVKNNAVIDDAKFVK